MLPRFFRLLLLPLGLLGACQPALEPGPRIDLIGSTRFTSADRRLSTAGDTVTTKLYTTTAESSPLSHVRILLTFTPQKNPLNYTDLLNRNVVYRNYPKDSIPLVYLDTLVSDRVRDFAFQTTMSTRTTSGVEKVTFESTDTEGRSSQTSIRLALHTQDSALVYHRYTIQLQAPVNFDSRPYLSLLSGLTFPRYSARMSQGVQQLVDLIYLPTANNGVVLASPSDTRIRLPWLAANRRATGLRTPVNTRTLDDFNRADTPEELTSAYDTATPLPDLTRTGALTKGQVIAFRTADNKSGLLYVDNLVLTPVPSVILQVHITK